MEVVDIHARCVRCGASVEPGDARCAVCALVLDAPAAVEARVVVVRCTWCGAAVAYDERAGAARCAFCASEARIEELPDPMEQAGWYAARSVTPNEARVKFGEWIGRRGWFAPGDLRERARVDEVRAIWWPAWVFDARALVSWTADSDAGAANARWAPHAGQCEMLFTHIPVAASRALRDDETAALLPSYRLTEDAGGAAPPDDDGAVIEQFELQRSAARERVLDGARRTAAARVAAEHVPGHRTRHVHADLLLRDLRTRRVALPAYVLAYRYRDKLYRAVVSGHDATFITGTAPRSPYKIALVIAAALALLAAAAWWQLGR